MGKLLYDAGMVIKRGVAVEAIRRGDDGTLVVVLAEGKGEVVADKVLAAHRLPNSAGLGLHELGVKLALSQVEGPVLSGVEGPVLSGVEGLVLSGVEGMEQGAVLVNERMETSVPHIYAVGDVTAVPMLSHKANVEGIIASLCIPPSVKRWWMLRWTWTSGRCTCLLALERSPIPNALQSPPYDGLKRWNPEPEHPRC